MNINDLPIDPKTGTTPGTWTLVHRHGLDDGVFVKGVARGLSGHMLRRIVSVIGPEISEFHREDLPPAPEPAEEAKAPETTEEEPVANKDEGDSTGKPSDEDGAPSDEQGNEAEASEPTAAADASEKKQGKKKRK